MDELSEAFKYHQAGQWEAAEQLYQIVLRHRLSADILNNLGNVQAAQGKLQDAIQSLHQAIQLRPDFAQAKYNLSNLFLQTHQFDLAISFLRLATQAHPDFPPLALNLGNAYQAHGDHLQSIAAYQLAIAQNPEYFEAYYNQAIAYQTIGDYARAELGYLRSLKLRPEFSHAWNNLGCVCNELGDYSRAAACFERSLQLPNATPDTHINLAASLQELGRWSEAKLQIENVKSILPDASLALLVQLKQLLCDWENIDDLSQQVIDLVRASASAVRFNGKLPPDFPPKSIPPLNLLSLPIETSPDDQRACAELWCLGIHCPSSVRTRSPSTRNRRLRIGYVSADFRDHPVGHLISELIPVHSTKEFEIVVYSLQTDSECLVMENLVESGVTVQTLDNLSLDEIVATIEADGIDILVDLQGHTRGARTEIFGRRPAPIQVGYLGYPATIGGDFIDYLIADDFVIPNESRPAYSECIVSLPHCYLTSQRHRPLPQSALTRSACGLPENALVLCGFTSSYKLTKTIFDVWLELIEYSPHCVLWLRDEHPDTTANLRKYACRKLSQPNASQRIVFAPRVPMDAHLQRQALADLFLDTFPYNQHSTAADALALGVPILTIAGNCFASRVAGSLLDSLSIPSLITDSVTAYTERAKFFIDHPEQLRELRSSVVDRVKNSPVFDAKRFVESLESAFKTMWDRYSTGQMPTAFAVPMPASVIDQL